MQQNDTQPQFDDVDEFAHVFDSTLPELTRRALLSDDSDGCSDAVGIGRMPKNSDGRKQLGDEWKIKLPYAVGHKARAKAKQDGISLSSLARRAITGYLRTRNQDEHPLF